MVNMTVVMTQLVPIRDHRTVAHVMKDSSAHSSHDLSVLFRPDTGKIFHFGINDFELNIFKASLERVKTAKTLMSALFSVRILFHFIIAVRVAENPSHRRL